MDFGSVGGREDVCNFLFLQRLKNRARHLPYAVDAAGTVAVDGRIARKLLQNLCGAAHYHSDLHQVRRYERSQKFGYEVVNIKLRRQHPHREFLGVERGVAVLD